MNCEQCGRPWHPLRAQCDFCGGEASGTPSLGLDEAVTRARVTAAGLWARVRGLRVERRPSLRLLALGSGALVALLVALLVLTTRDTAQPDVDAVPASAAESPARQAELQAALDVAEALLRDIEAAQGRTLSAAASRAATAAGEVARLREQVTKAEASAKAEKETAERIERRIQALSECLNGTAVALQFGRTGAWDPADRALAAVSAACVDARALR